MIASCIVTALDGCGGGGGGGGPRSCVEDTDCEGAARCLAQACVADLAPVAVLHAPGDPKAFDLVELDGSESSDADAPLGDHIAQFHWSIESLDQACQPPVIAGSASPARVRFPCAGAFRVQLVVVDERGVESAPVSADLSVAAHEGTISVSADHSLGHRCSGTPLTCTLDGTPPVVTAGVTAGVQTIGTVAYHWVAEGTDAHRTVTFAPSPDIESPSVSIQVDSTAHDAIVDDWVLRVTATDEVGVVGEAATRISVTNRPPELHTTPTVVQVDHTFSSGYYRATANLDFWQDPDGDPMDLATDSVGTSACPTLSTASNGRIRVDCLKKYTGTPDQSGFSGDHVLKIRPRDHWRTAKDLTSVTIRVANRPVTAADTSATLSGRCTATSACCEYESGKCMDHDMQCKEATGTMNLTVSDEDGDPVRVTMSGMTPTSFLCGAGVACAVQYSIAANTYCRATGVPGSASGSFSVTDGKVTIGPYWASAD